MDESESPGLAGYVLLGFLVLLLVYSVWASVQLRSVTEKLDDQITRTEKQSQMASEMRTNWIKCEARNRSK